MQQTVDFLMEWLMSSNMFVSETGCKIGAKAV